MTSKSLIAWLKANPDKASAGTGGVGSPPHISGIFFQKMTGTQFQFVPYRGTAPAMRDLLAGQIDIMIDQASNVLPQLRAGTIKAFAVTSQGAPAVGARGADRRRSRAARPLCLGVARPVGAQGHAGRCHRQAERRGGEGAGRAGTREKLAALGQDIPPVDQLTPQALGAFQKAEIEKWWPIVKAAGIKAE